MKEFIGTKILNAKPINRLDYNELRGWDLPEDEDGSDEGYLVEYNTEANEPNVTGFEGYISWSPKAVFEESYVATEGLLSFSNALDAIKIGAKVARKGWNGKNMFLFLVDGSTFTVNRPPLLGMYPEGTVVHYHAHIDMRTADGMIVPWLASQTDMLANDWMVVA